MKDDQINLSRYKIYLWLTDAEVRDLKIENPPTLDFIAGYTEITRRPDLEPLLEKAVDDNLQAKGLTRGGGNPDFYVTLDRKSVV